MTEYRTGNIWDALDSGEAQAIVIPVNCVGVMGAGLAKQAKERGYFDEYNFVCRTQVMFGGKVHWSEFPHRDNGGGVAWHYPIFAFTKENWRNPSRIEWIEKILSTIDRYKPRGKCPVVAVPALGCGLGGLDWSDVKPLCEKYLSDSPTKFLIYEPK